MSPHSQKSEVTVTLPPLLPPSLLFDVLDSAAAFGLLNSCFFGGVIFTKADVKLYVDQLLDR